MDLVSKLNVQNNSHLELEVNGKKYYVGSMIRNYAKMSEQEIMQTVDKLQFSIYVLCFKHSSAALCNQELL